MALVYDLGGGTFDVTVVRYTPTHFQVLATDGDVHLGGIDWNDRLVDYVAERIQEPARPRSARFARHGADAAARCRPGQDHALAKAIARRSRAATRARRCRSRSRAINSRT